MTGIAAQHKLLMWSRYYLHLTMESGSLILLIRRRILDITGETGKKAPGFFLLDVAKDFFQAADCFLLPQPLQEHVISHSCVFWIKIWA
jgi:hypothetical protein